MFWYVSMVYSRLHTKCHDCVSYFIASTLVVFLLFVHSSDTSAETTHVGALVRYVGPLGTMELLKTHHQRHDCLLNRLVRRRSKKTSKFCVTGLCGGNSPVTGDKILHWIMKWPRDQVIYTSATYLHLWGEFTDDSGFPAHRASKTERVYILWRHPDYIAAYSGCRWSLCRFQGICSCTWRYPGYHR